MTLVLPPSHLKVVTRGAVKSTVTELPSLTAVTVGSREFPARSSKSSVKVTATSWAVDGIVAVAVHVFPTVLS